MATPAERVVDLIRLACDAGAAEPEQRSAALIACRLIVRHSLFVGEPLNPSPATQSAPASPPPAAKPAPAAWSRPRPERATRTPRAAPRAIRMRYRSRCCQCWGMVERGDLCIWVSGIGVSHPACYHD